MGAPIMSTAERLLAPTAAEVPATNPDITVGLQKLDELRPGYVEADQYFRNQVPEVFATPRMRRALERTGSRYKINFAAIPVKAVVARIKVASTTVPGNDDATAWIARQWERNELDLYLPDVIRTACSLGDAYLFCWPVDEDDQEDNEGATDEFDVPTVPDSRSDQDTDREPLDVDIHLNEPLTTVVIYDAENPRKARFMIRRWAAGDRVRVDLYYRDRVEKYTTKKGVATAKSMDDLIRYVDPDDVVDEDEDEWPRPNPYGEIPGHHFRTQRPYGEPVHKEFYGPQDAIRKCIVGHLSTVDYQTARQRYALMDGDDSSEAAAVDEDEFSIFDDETGTSRPGGGLSADSQLEAGPDTVWWLKNVKSVGTFEEADPSKFLDPAEKYLRFGAQVSETPIRFFDYARAQLPSGVSQDAADVPFVKRLEDLITSFKATLQAMWRSALRMAGWGDLHVVVDFAPPERVTGIEGWKVVEAKIDVGISPRVAIMQAGFTTEQVDAMLGPDDGNLHYRLTVLKQLGEALQMLGAAVALQTMPPEQISDLVGAFLPDAMAAMRGPERGDE